MMKNQEEPRQAVSLLNAAKQDADYIRNLSHAEAEKAAVEQEPVGEVRGKRIPCNDGDFVTKLEAVFTREVSIGDKLFTHAPDSAAEIALYKKEIEALKVKKFARFNNEDCWIFQNDEHDNLESLVCPVVVSPEFLLEQKAEIALARTQADQFEKLLHKQAETIGAKDAEIARLTKERDEWKDSAVNGGNARYLRDELTACQEENKRLMKELESLSKGCKISVPSDTMEQCFSAYHKRGYDKAKAEYTQQLAAALEADAERYRWLRDESDGIKFAVLYFWPSKSSPSVPIPQDGWVELEGEKLDAAIDAARGEKK